MTPVPTPGAGALGPLASGASRLAVSVSWLEGAGGTASFVPDGARMVSRTVGVVDVPRGVLLRDFVVVDNRGAELVRLAFDDHAVIASLREQGAYRRGVIDGRRKERRRILRKLRKAAGL